LKFVQPALSPSALRYSFSLSQVSKVGPPLGLDHVGSNPIAFDALDSELEFPQADGHGAFRCFVSVEPDRERRHARRRPRVNRE
jgi:hypothetical protein